MNFVVYEGGVEEGRSAVAFSVSSVPNVHGPRLDSGRRNDQRIRGNFTGVSGDSLNGEFAAREFHRSVNA